MKRWRRLREALLTLAVGALIAVGLPGGAAFGQVYGDNVHSVTNGGVNVRALEVPDAEQPADPTQRIVRWKVQGTGQHLCRLRPRGQLPGRQHRLESPRIHVARLESRSPGPVPVAVRDRPVGAVVAGAGGAAAPAAGSGGGAGAAGLGAADRAVRVDGTGHPHWFADRGAPVDTPEKIAQLQSGDVITYLPRPEDPTLVTHRITAVSVSEDGSRTFTTQGDANTSPDEPVTEQMIRGELRYHVPWVGYAANALTGQQKNVTIIVLAVGLFGYAGWQVLRAVGERRQAATAKPRRAVVE